MDLNMIKDNGSFDLNIMKFKTNSGFTLNAMEYKMVSGNLN